ncbi:hypothetical protein F8388_022892 [Cannabis sativa]|uniref:Uncharacterized protein n=1 Tax=Cannabis sativa TaxID=3483 RepID=A0A7J6FEW2_CANSA|nr:hypothetical protein F8388_022892 [Cannabis sativa]
MVKSLEAIKGGGGSIRVGTTGTIISLMTRELQSMDIASKKPSSSFDNKPQADPVTPRRLKPKKSSDEATSSGIKNYRKSPEFSRKTKGYPKKAHRIPMLNSDNVVIDRTHIREKPDKKGSNIVEVVDIKCGNTDRAWKSPITSRLRKLGFSKLSESII